MGDLPFLVVHGAWVWKTVVLLSAITGAAIYALIHRRRVRRWLGPVAPGLAGEVTPLDALSEGAPALLRGRLRAADEIAAATLSLRPSPGIREQTVHADGRTEQLELDVGGTRVPLRGDVHVLVGSREETRRGAPAHIPPLLRPGFDRLAREYTWISADTADAQVVVGRCSLDVVGDGDELVVAGTARSRAGNDTSAGYRDLARAWQFEGTEGHALYVAALEPGRARLRPAAPWFAGSALVSALVGLVSVWSVGQLALHCAGDHPTAEDGDALAIAAATPARNRALQRLEDAYRQDTIDPVLIARRAALAALQGECDRQAEPFEASRQWERAAAIRRSCGPAHSGELVANLLQLGDATGAAEVAAKNPMSVPAELAFESFLLARRWAEASQAATMLALSRDNLMLREEWECIAAAAATRAGDASALVDLRRDAMARNIEPECVWLYLDAIPPAERATFVDRWIDRQLGAASPRLPDALHSSMGHETAILLALEADPVRLADVEPFFLHRWTAGDDLIEPFRRELTEPFWAMAPHVLAAADRAGLPAEASRGHARFAELTAMVELLGGDRDRARALTGRAEALWKLDPTAFQDQEVASDVDALRASIAYRGGDMLDRRLDYLGEHLALRRGQPIREGAVLAGRIDQAREQSLRAALAQAALGDGHALAAEPDLHRYYGFHDWVFAVAPRLTAGADAIAELVTWSEEDTDTLPPLATRLYRAAGYRDLFTLLGDREQAARWKAIADRHMRLFRDRELVVFLQVAGR